MVHRRELRPPAKPRVRLTGAHRFHDELEALNPRQKRFVLEYAANNGDVGNAARRAGYEPSEAPFYGHELAKHPKIKPLLRKIDKGRMARLEINGDMTAKYWWTLANADARELNPVRRGCCRYCYGQDNCYQFTQAEYRAEMRKHLVAQLKIRDPKARKAFDEQGGDGYDKTREPNPECPECRGFGTAYLVPLDLESLSPGARMLFDGYKFNGKDGTVEIKLRDRSRAMENFQHVMGFVKARKAIEEWDPDKMTDEQLDAVLTTAMDRGLLKLTDQRTVQRGPLEIDGEATVIENEEEYTE